MQRDSDYLYLRGKEIDQDSIVYKMEDYSDLIFELQSANYADGTELDEKELEELEGTEELIDWVRIDYVSESAEMGGVNENPETDYEGSMDYELSGDDGEVAHGTIHYKAINGVVDPKSLEGSYEYDGNHKVDDEYANQMIQPGGEEHEEALKAAQEDYEYEAGRMKSKFGMENQDDKELSNKENTVEDFVKSFFDYTSNQFPKGETAVLTSVEKKFGDNAVATAQETIQNLMANKDPEIAKIKKLAGIQ